MLSSMPHCFDRNNTNSNVGTTYILRNKSFSTLKYTCFSVQKSISSHSRRVFICTVIFFDPRWTYGNRKKFFSISDAEQNQNQQKLPQTPLIKIKTIYWFLFGFIYFFFFFTVPFDYPYS